MCKILVIQHVPHEGLGIIGPALERAGFKADFLEVYRGQKIQRTTEGYSALIVLGGPMGVYEEDTCPFIRPELKLIESALKDRVPTLGICLGSQLLARAAGARVYKGGKKEIGWYKVNLTDKGSSDRLFLGLPDSFTVFQWHGDTFDAPAGGELIASSELFPNQVIRVGPNAYGVQFHLEVTEGMIKEWIEENKEELKGLKGKIDPEQVLINTPANIQTLHKYGHAVISRFLRMVDL